MGQGLVERLQRVTDPPFDPGQALGQGLDIDPKLGRRRHRRLRAERHGAALQGSRLTELGRFYRDYVELMAHFDKVLPGRIHRVIYEDMVADPESEVRRLLDYLGLPFEEGCLRFYETKRTVLTPSSEQVRKPISGEAVDYWKNYEPWLGPLIRSLGSVFTEYPAVPEELR